MTDQQVFDTVVRHLAKQGRPSIGDEGACKYRSGELSCAVGCLLTDEEYDPRQEGRPAVRMVPFRLAGNIELLGDLQDVHDRFDNYWPSALRRVAMNHKLDTGVIVQADWSHYHAWRATT